MSKTVKIIFTLSLLLNIALIGVSAGCWWKRHAHHGGPFSDASAETRAVFRSAFEAQRPAMRADIDAIRATRVTLEGIVAAPAFDRAAYDAQVEKVLDIRDSMGRRRADILGDVLEKLPPEERARIGRRITAKLTDDRPRHGRKHGPAPAQD